MREEHLPGKKNASKTCILSMLLWMRRGCDHPWMAKRFWEDQRRLMAREGRESPPASVLHVLDEHCSAKTEELLKIVMQHPGRAYT